jgi:hypothetical protein
MVEVFYPSFTLMYPSKFKFKFKFSYDRRSIGLSNLASDHLVGPVINFPFSPRILASDICVSFSVYSALSDERMGLQCTRTNATGLRQRCHSRIQVSLYLRLYPIVLFEAGLHFCRPLHLAGLQGWYSNSLPHGVVILQEWSGVEFATDGESASTSWCRAGPFVPMTRFYMFFCLICT